MSIDYYLSIMCPVHSAIAIALGYLHTCAIVSGGGAKCWGNNDYGQLGNGDTSQYYSPVNVNDGSISFLPHPSHEMGQLFPHSMCSI